MRDDTHAHTITVSRTALFAISAILLIAGFFIGTQQASITAFFSQFYGVKTSADTIDLSSVQRTYQYLSANYDGELDEQKLIDGANKGLVAAAGDKYTAYMTAEEADEFNAALRGDVGAGIGAAIGERDGQPTITKLLKGNPAIESGLAVGDVIVKVNDESTEGLSAEKAAEKIRGEEGTSVKLTVSRGGEAKTFTLTRAHINNPSVEYTINDGVGIITITRFDGETGQLAAQAAQAFKDADVEGVILDLRGDGGGYIKAAVDVANLWLSDKVIVTQKAGDMVIDEQRSTATAPLKGIKTIVLTNGGSASASEIVASALRDNDAAILLGETTYGKGSVQEVIDLADGPLLKVTVARWYSSGGYNVSDKGLKPDVVVKLDEKALANGTDNQLQAALKRLQQ